MTSPRNIIRRGTIRQATTGVSTVKQWAPRLLVAILIVTTMAAGPAAAAEKCPSPPKPIQDLEKLLTELQRVVLGLGVLAAGLMYAVSGGMYILGGRQRQDQARAYFVQTSLGLIIVLMSSGFVQFVKDIIGCGV